MTISSGFSIPTSYLHALTAPVRYAPIIGMAYGKVLALDYGTKNIGIACCDELRVTVRPLPSLEHGRSRGLLDRILRIVRENDIREVVVGIPLNMDGTSGEAVRRSERFMESLRDHLAVPLHGVDERLSTVEALEIWNGMSRRRQQKYRTVDSLAAAFILSRYLEES